MSEVGKDYLRAYELFFDVLSRDVGVLVIDGEEYSVELRIVDDLADPHEAWTAYNTFVMTNVTLLLGPASSPLTRVAASIAEDAGAVLVAPGTSDTDIFLNRSRVFGILPAFHTLVSPVANALAARGANTVAYVTEDYSTPRAMCDALPEHSQQRGLTLLSSQIISMSNVATVVQNLLRLNPDVVYGCVLEELCRELLAEARRQNLNPKALVLPFCVTEPDFLQKTQGNGEYAIGAMPQLSILPLTPGSPSMGISEFRERWRRQHQTTRDPSHAAVAAFNACATLLLAVQAARSTDPRAVAAALGNLVDVRFDQNGQSISDAVVVQYSMFQSSLKVVAPLDKAEHSLWYPRPQWQDWACYDWRSPNAHAGIAVNASTNETVCAACEEGRYSQFGWSLGRRVCQECTPGRVLDRGLAHQDVQCRSCSAGMMNVRIGSSGTCDLCPEGRFQNQSEQTDCHNCPPGRFQDNPGGTQCYDCAAVQGNHYSSQPGSIVCNRCPEGGLCEMDSQGLFSSLSNQDDYHLLPSDDPHEEPWVHWCPHGQGLACLSHGRCEETMEGLMCGRCRQGFGRSDPLDLCTKCKGLGFALWDLLLGVFLTSLLLVAVIAMILMTDFSKPSQTHSVIAKQFINYVQMAGVSMGLMLSFGSSDIFAGLASAANYIRRLTSRGFFSLSAVSCCAWQAFPDTEYYKVVQVLGLLWVPSSLAIVCAMFGLTSAVGGWLGYERPSWRMLVTMVIVSLYLMLSMVTELNLASWHCHHYDVPRLVFDPSVKCFSPEHRTWLVVGAVGCSVSALGIPIALYLTLSFYHVTGRIHDPEVLQMLGFLTSGLTQESWFFESLFMLRKVLFIVVPRLPGFSSGWVETGALLQVYALLSISGMFLFLIHYYEPYDNRGYYILDRIEGASMMAVFMTLLVSVMSRKMDNLLLDGTWERKLRDICCGVVVVGLHGRALLLMLWGLTRGKVGRIIPGMLFEATDRPAWYTRVLMLLVGTDQVKILPTGLELHGTDKVCKKLLCDMFGDIVRLQIDKSGTITFQGITSTMKRVIVETQHLRELESLASSSPIAFLLMRIQRKIDRLPVGREAVQGIIAGVKSSMKGLGMKVSLRLGSGRKLSADQTHGRVYAIEELYTALMLLGDDAYQEEEGHHEGHREERVTCMESDMPGSLDPYHFGMRLAGSDMKLSASQVLDSQLRAARQERQLKDLSSKAEDSVGLPADAQSADEKPSEAIGAESAEALAEELAPQQVEPTETSSSADIALAVETVGVCGGPAGQQDVHQHAVSPTSAWSESVGGALTGSRLSGSDDPNGVATSLEALSDKSARNSDSMTSVLARRVRYSSNDLEREIRNLAKEIRSLTMERDNARVEMGQVELSLRTARMEAERQHHLAQESEAKLERLGLEASSWRQWAKGLPGKTEGTEAFHPSLSASLEPQSTSEDTLPDEDLEPEQSLRRAAFLASCTPQSQEIQPSRAEVEGGRCEANDPARQVVSSL